VLVAERVGESLDGLAGRDRVAVQVQLSVELDEGHGRAVAGEDGERGRAQMLALERMSVGRGRRDRRRPAAVRHAETVHDVFGLDAGPHDDAHLGEPGADVGEFDREPSLRGVELGRPIE
jgi:hypothetical protein